MLIEFILPTFNRVNELFSSLYSLMAQTDQRWKATVLIDEKQAMPAETIVKIIDDERISYVYAGKRYNDWGHTPREMGKQASTANYVIMSGDDCYYIPTCVGDIIAAAKDQPGIIYWDMVHSHYNYSYFKTAPWMNQIDIGAFATRIDLAKQLKLKTSYAADGEYIQEFKEKFPLAKIKKIEKILFVHN